MANAADIKNQIKNKETQQKQVPTTNTQQVTLQNALTSVFPSIKSILPEGMSPSRLMRIVLTSTQQTPALAQCTPESIIGAVVNCAVLGLEPGPLGHVYLIPYKNNKNGNMECQFQIGYKGLIELIRRSGNVRITAHEVYENDEFDYQYGLDEDLKHKPARGDRGKVIYYYSTYKLNDGGFGFEVLSKEDVEKHRDKFSKAKKFGPWVDNFDAMALKTVVKQMAKFMPISIDVQQQLTMDSQTISIKNDVKNPQEAIDVFDYQYADDTTEIA